MRRATTLLLCLLLALGALAVAGCGGDDDNGSAAETTAAPAETTEGTASSGGGVAIDAVDIKFKPQTATAKVGEKVTWTNKDQIAHTVTSEQGAPEKFDSGTLDGGKTFSFTPTKAGEYPYVCQIHPSQTGTLTVTE
jgi:plastocyanin